MSADKRDRDLDRSPGPGHDSGRDALEDEFRAMFAERSETVRVATAPYAAVRQRIVAARRARRMRIGSAGVAFAMAVVGVGVWTAVPSRHDAAIAPTTKPLKAGVYYADGTTEIPAGPLRNAALDWLRANYKKDVSKLAVITTFNRDVQTAAEKNASDGSGVAVVDSQNGGVLALAGTWSQALPVADLMKPIVLAAAFKDGAYGPDSKVPLDSATHPLYWPASARQPMMYVGTDDKTAYWPPESSLTHIQDTEVTLRQAAEIGANEPFAQVGLASGIGPAVVRDMAVGLGMPISSTNLFAVPSVVLGMGQATPVTMAGVYATLADGGVRHDQRMVAEVVGMDGKVVWKAPETGTRVLPATDAQQVTDVLHSALSDGTTGTDATARAQAASGAWAMAGAPDPERGAWFDGGESHYVVAVGVFKAASDHGGPVVGSRVAGPVWASVVNALTVRD